MFPTTRSIPADVIGLVLSCSASLVVSTDNTPSFVIDRFFPTVTMPAFSVVTISTRTGFSVRYLLTAFCMSSAERGERLVLYRVPCGDSIDTSTHSRYIMPLPIRAFHFEQVFFYFWHLSKIAPFINKLDIRHTNHLLTYYFYWVKIIAL